MNKVFPVLMLVLGFVAGTSVTIAYAGGIIDLVGAVVVDGTLTIQDGIIPLSSKDPSSPRSRMGLLCMRLIFSGLYGSTSIKVGMLLPKLSLVEK